MKVYISGKIGEETVSEATREKFARAQRMLEEKGYETFNPCEEKWQQALKKGFEKEKKSYSVMDLDGEFPSLYSFCLLRDLMVLSTKDAIYMLADWKLSLGAAAEFYTAAAMQKHVLFENRGHAERFLRHKFLHGAAKSEPYCSDKRPWNRVMDQYVNDHINELWMPIDPTPATS